MICNGTFLSEGHWAATSSNYAWMMVDMILMMVIIIGNSTTLYVIWHTRRLSSIMSNQFVTSLGISDIFLGLTLPYHLAFYLCNGLSTSKVTCILRFVLIIAAVSSSMYNLMAIAFDRYIAIIYPLHYTRFITQRVITIIIAFGWLNALVLATAPIYWNAWKSNQSLCDIQDVLHRSFVGFVLTPAFLIIWAIMFIIYWRIWRVASRHAKRIQETPNNEGVSNKKSIQVVLMVHGCFSVCWLPYFVVACLCVFHVIDRSVSQIIYKLALSLGMFNSCLNPFIYAWKNSEFKKAMVHALCCQTNCCKRTSATSLNGDQIKCALYQTDPTPMQGHTPVNISNPVMVNHSDV